MKKLVILLVIFNFTLLAFNTNNIKAAEDINDKISIELIKDGNEVSINTSSNININYVVVEYVVLEKNQKISRLTQLEVKNNKFEIESNYIAIKVHQIKSLKNNVYYRYSVDKENSINYSFGDFSNVIRKNIAEVKTDKIESKTNGITRYYNFYFTFNKKHDKLLSITVDYVKVDYIIFKFTRKTNITEKIDNNDFFKYLFVDIKKFEKIDNDQYIVRINRAATGWIENFAIIQIEYEINGEFYIDDVLNDPTTPKDELNWFLELIEKIKSIFNKLISFLKKNSNNIALIFVVIIAIIALSFLIKIFNIFIFFYKIFKSLIRIIIDSFKYLFIPKNYKKKRGLKL